MINTKMATGFTTNARALRPIDMHETSRENLDGTRTPRAYAYAGGQMLRLEHGVKVTTVKRDGFAIRWCYAA